ncbi:L,D-transpeptidase [Vagococcus zengguangii]|uniref:L,D-transpeptidase n=2 Tax=Vagococcus zengguangii TaxID=2571750 RepID=A0A4D7CXT6_9ENTE|nr:L,D-transpeptidase [Vagococcus zengguangii]TLG81843.1 L,D-transpeptidase [Vagococcus zengguangii]
MQNAKAMISKAEKNNKGTKQKASKHNSSENNKESLTTDTTQSTVETIDQLKETVHPWNEPSEPAYPNIQHPEAISIEVSIADQRVYIKEQDKTIYTMICSTGDSKAGTPTPTGEFVIEPERGDKFYWADDDDWAYNWVSFSGHGIYLFHSVLMWNEHEVEEKEAVRLGQEASHGCIRLPLPDSKWFYDNITTGTPVTIS